MIKRMVSDGELMAFDIKVYIRIYKQQLKCILNRKGSNNLRSCNASIKNNLILKQSQSILD